MDPAAPNPALRALLLRVTVLLVPKTSHPRHQWGHRGGYLRKNQTNFQPTSNP